MINSGSELNKIIYLILIILFGCNSLHYSESESKITVSPEVKKRVQELIKNNNKAIGKTLIDIIIVDGLISKFRKPHYNVC